MTAKPKIKGLEHEGSERLAAAAFADLEKKLYWNDHPEARPANVGARYTPLEMAGLELRRYLVRIYRERVRQGLAVGSLDGWARAVAHVTARVDNRITVQAASRHCARIGIGIPDDIFSPIVHEVAAAKAAGTLTFNARMLGEALQLTAAEREEYGVRRFIDACDESRSERDRRRKATERRRSGAKPRSTSASATKPWIVDGYTNRRTWERHGKKPKMSQTRPRIQNLNKEEECADEFATKTRYADEFATNGEDENE